MKNQNKWRASNLRETLPQSVIDKLEKVEAEDKVMENDLMVPNEEAVEKLKGIVGDEAAEAFVRFAEDIEAGKIENSTILTLDGDFSDKQKRTDVHHFFKQSMKKYESDTLSLGEMRKIRVFFKEGVSKNKR